MRAGEEKPFDRAGRECFPERMSSMASTLRITDLDPAALGDDDARALAEVSNAAEAVDAPHLDPVDADYVRRSHAYNHDMQPTHGLLVAYDQDRIVGYAGLHTSTWDNPQLVFVDLLTHPDLGGHGAGDALLARALERARAEGRTEVVGDAWIGSHRADFWERHGFPVASRAANRRLLLADLDHSLLARLLAEAEAASAGYELVDLPAPAPEELVPDLLALHLAMNDAPLDDLRLEDDAWPVERFRGYEQAMAARGMRLHRLLARRTSDGELGGHTVVVVEEDRPTLGFQEDTAVITGHRGHKLGLRLKIAMLRVLSEREPQLRYTDTWNAESNTHMIAVNDAIGCVVVGRGQLVQRTLEL